MLEVHRWRQIDWAPSAVVALATSVDGTVVAAARENGSIELWNVAPGSVGWHCHLTIPGREEAAISSLVWCKSGGDQSTPLGRLFSAGLDGFITEWNLQTLQPKEISESYGGSVWQLAAEPLEALKRAAISSNGALLKKNSDGSDNDEGSSSDSDSEEEEEEGSSHHDIVEQRIAVGCDDGCVRIFTVGDNQAGMLYRRAFPRVKGRILSVTWSLDATRVYAGGSDGCIRCWDSKTVRELFRITAGIGGRGAGSELCVWSLLALRNGTIVSGDSTGSTQFWEGEHGTLLQGHSKHNADVLALAAAPAHNVVFAAGADGQVTLYQLVDESSGKDANGTHPTSEKNSLRVRDRWVYVGNKRNHTHDVKALALAYPVVQEEGQTERPVQKRRRKSRAQMKNDYKKWAQPGIPMLISGGNDCKLFTYPAEAFLAFHPHDICHAPQRPQVQFAGDLSSSGLSVLMAQHSTWIDVWKMNTNRNAVTDMELGYEFGKEVLGKRKFRDEANYVVGNPIKMNGTGEKKLPVHPASNGRSSPYPSKQVASTKGVAPALLARIKCKTVEHIACSAISGDGKYVAFSDRLKPRLFQLEQQQVGASNSLKAKGIIAKKKLSPSLPAAQCMLFTPDSTRLLLGSTQQIMVINVENGEVLHSFKVAPPSARGPKGSLSPINFMCTSADSQWLAATTSSGYIHIFSLEALRHHWSVPVMDGTVATSAIFRPSSSNVLIISTAGNQLHVLDVEAKELTKWSTANGEVLSMRLLDFPGGITGLSVPPTPVSTTVIAYSSRAMVQIDFSKPVKLYSHEPKEKSQAHANGNGAAPKQNGSSSVHTDNFAYVPFKDPVLFLGHTAQSSVLVVEKPWLEVLRQIPAPVYRHLYGT
ncbi:U3 small nucleolar RNA-associated protein 4 [Marchantia polymorpha subsp. ruderalis]|uniref:Anaphase-promoting complex subunit 4 WD40 domain-containing protein n=2 Tax=Marchantia polymorpha TaxID=3197 RepID=A0AAF6BF26_MARPO|nr:hypothetical protein MARPO_0027s0127 [Marchantia polymorpha]BBN10610.1 hypothetical protein Mp_5g05000 [Marchantia polymorpha subsp. ruderalis]|eukprot:PTQ43025.1 hypothetical protein MARPO_0027s0127 [Marchantia polymorpha]